MTVESPATATGQKSRTLVKNLMPGVMMVGEMMAVGEMMEVLEMTVESRRSFQY